MALNFGEDFEHKKIELDDQNFKTFEGFQIKLNDSSSSEKGSERTTGIESKEVLLLANSQVEPKSDHPLNTLKEPILETLKRDLYNISEKIRFVLLPKENDANFKHLLYNCKFRIYGRGSMGSTFTLSFTLASSIFFS